METGTRVMVVDEDGNDRAFGTLEYQTGSWIAVREESGRMDEWPAVWVGPA